MTAPKSIYLIPYLASLALSAAILYYAWTRKHKRETRAYKWYVLGQTLWIGAFIIELISNSMQAKIFWDGFQWLCSLAILIAIPFFVVEYTEYKIRHRRRVFLLALVAPVSFGLVVLSDPLHHLIYANPALTPPDPFAELFYPLTWVVYLYAIYSYTVIGWSIYLLIRRLLRPQGLYRAQILAIIWGFLIPVAPTLLSLVGLQVTPERDPIPFSTAVGNLVIAWGLYRYRIFDVIPIGRDRVFDSLADPIVILDKNNIIIDINDAMLALLDKKESQVIGEPARVIFDDFPIPIKMHTQVSYARSEAVFEINKKQIHYELTVWPLFNADKQMTGRVYISHDITALKELEGELRKLNTKLEDRVQERTHELEEAYESLLEGMARALELRDRDTEGHSRRVTENALKIAQKMGIQGKDLDDIRSGAILHDIGKISIPDEILHKKGRLTPEERVIIEQHPTTAYKLLSSIPILNKTVEIPYYHHEKWDGTGYPQGLKGEEIPLSARIFAVADVWDALSNDRPYNKAWSREQIIEYFKEQTGLHFDPIIARLFLSMVEKGEI